MATVTRNYNNSFGQLKTETLQAHHTFLYIVFTIPLQLRREMTKLT